MIEPNGFKKTPKWLNTISGIFLFFILSLCLLGAISFLTNPITKNPIMEYIFGIIFLLLSLWGFEKSIYLIFNIDSENTTLLSSRTLYIGSLFFFLLAIYGVYIGQQNRMTFSIYFRVIPDLIFSISLFLLARKYSK